MATFSSFAEFGQAIAKMEADIERDRKVWALEMGKRAQSIAEAAASADLGGDPKFSGWKPPLDTHLKVIEGGVVLMPTRSSAGPWTVAERGRNQGNASGFSGPGINRKTGATARTKSGGVRKTRATGGKRWNGTTKGKQTASQAVAKMESELTPIAERAVHKTIIRHFDVD